MRMCGLDYFYFNVFGLARLCLSFVKQVFDYCFVFKIYI
jgi:hypothetical protein